ncbi:MAG: lipoyl protein ligase domain-containing protein [Chitinophagales bacterium]
MRLSLGTAGVLGLSRVRQSDLPTTAYLMLEGRCGGGCAFCPQARNAEGRDDRLSRIIWPSFGDDELLARLGELGESQFRRLCVQGVNAPGWKESLRSFLASLKEVPHPPVSLSLTPCDPGELAEWFALGVDRIGIPLDAATPEVFAKVKSGDFHRTLELFEAASAAFPGRISTHLIVGLGESEREAAEMLARLYGLGLTVGLFAFTPVPGTPLASLAPPDLGVYRRLQVARWLLHNHLLAPGAPRPGGGWEGPFRFDAAGRLAGFTLSAAQVRAALAGGEAFQTSGCPDCNRPYYNERPGGTQYNFPRPLTPGEVSRALAETGLPGLVDGPGDTGTGETGGAPTRRWRLLETGAGRGAWNMAVDEALMEAVGRGEAPPTLRFYGWDPPALSLGYFQDRDREVDLAGCAAQGFDCVRRPTGGRAVLHADEVTYAIVVPESYPGFGGSVIEAYRAIGEGLAAGLRKLGVPAEMTPAERRGGERSAACFDAPSFYELVVDGRKLVGSAQVRRHGAILQHGSILLSFAPDQLVRCLAAPGRTSREALQRALTGKATSLSAVLGRPVGFAEVAQAVAQGVAETFGVELEPGGLSAAERERAEELARSKYETETWNGRRPGEAASGGRS